jgi:hypothetical protein
MTNHHYRTLLGAALAATFIGAAVAQTTSDDASRLPANKGMPQAEQAQPADQSTDKMKGQSDEQAPASDQSGKKSSNEKSGKPARQASKSQPQRTAALDPSEKAFRQALRECAKQQEQSQRDSCLDSAIEQFQRS